MYDELYTICFFVCLENAPLLYACSTFVPFLFVWHRLSCTAEKPIIFLNCFILNGTPWFFEKQDGDASSDARCECFSVKIDMFVYIWIGAARLTVRDLICTLNFTSNCSGNISASYIVDVSYFKNIVLRRHLSRNKPISPQFGEDCFPLFLSSFHLSYTACRRRLYSPPVSPGGRLYRL